MSSGKGLGNNAILTDPDEAGSVICQYIGLLKFSLAKRLFEYKLYSSAFIFSATTSTREFWDWYSTLTSPNL